MSPDRSLWELTVAAGPIGPRFVADATERLELAGCRDRLASSNGFLGKSVLISSDRQLPAVRALLALEGCARRILLCPPDLPPEHVKAVLKEASVDAVVGDGTGPAARADVTMLPIPDTFATCRSYQSELLLFTSGTSGRPKLVIHDLGSVAGHLQQGPAGKDLVWSTFYDVRRYGGLQVLLRALFGCSSLVLSQAGEPATSFLRRAGEAGVTHILGTPSHWRQALMTGEAGRIAPGYVRLSGEIADQAILDALASAYPKARIVHAFASTEAGLGFEVTDGLAGFPAAIVGAAGRLAEVRVADGSLQLRSAASAFGYLNDRGTLADQDGFVETGDLVVRRGDRYVFAGRREGVINVGGQKVYPEEVEAVITSHAAVQVARVYPRQNPIMGAVVAAELVLHPQAPPFATVRETVLQLCRDALQKHKVPAVLTQVESIPITPSGKVVRSRA